MGTTKKNYLGTESERISAYYKDRSSNLRVLMLESRLTELHRQGITESPEIDKILEDIAIEQSKLQYGWGLE